MTDSEYQLMVQRNIASLLRYTIRLHCRHEVTKGLLAASLGKGDRESVAKALSEMERNANDLAEKMLLELGDTNPEVADLLGVQEFLRKHES